MIERERVKSCLTFSDLDRAPRDLCTSGYVKIFKKDEIDTIIKKYPLDIITFQLEYGSLVEEKSQLGGNVGHYTDYWGSVWYVGEPGVIGEVKEPALVEWSMLNKFKPPFHLIRGRDFSYINKSCEKSTKFVLSEVAAQPFQRLQFLRGTENLLMDIAYGEPKLLKLLKMVHEFYIEDIKSWCKSNVDGIIFLDDWGSNQALLINPKIWREIFKNLYKEYCKIIHNAGKFVFFHSDGNIEAIFDDLIEIGIDAINSQLFTMNIEKLAKKYKGKITFWGEIDRQHILPFGTPNDVYKAVMRVRHLLDDGTGGVIAQCEWGKNNHIANIKAVFDAWNEPLSKVF